MGYQLRSDEPVEEAVRRIAVAQIDEALRVAGDPARRARAPHEMRKRCKKLRGLLRLVRGAFPDYGSEQQRLRDIARGLAAAREAGALVEALQRLRAHDGERFGSEDFERACRWLTEAHEQAYAAGAFDAAIADAASALGALRQRVDGWRLDRRGFAAIDHGLVSTYRQARRAQAAARRGPDADRLHELRKRIKYHRHHLDLLQRMWPGPLAALIVEAEKLGELLGHHHDLDVLLAVLERQPSASRRRGASARMRKAVAPEAARLEAEAFALAARLLADSPGCFRARMAAWWDIWRDPGR